MKGHEAGSVWQAAQNSDQSFDLAERPTGPATAARRVGSPDHPQRQLAVAGSHSVPTCTNAQVLKIKW